MTVVVNKGEAVYKYIKCGTCNWWLGEERRRPQSYYYGHFLSSWFQWQSGKCLMNHYLNWTCHLRFSCRRLKLSLRIGFAFHALLCKYPASRGFFLAWLSTLTKSFAWLVSRVKTNCSQRPKHGKSTQKYNFKNAKIQRKTPRQSSKFWSFSNTKIIHRYLFTVLVCKLTPC